MELEKKVKLWGVVKNKNDKMLPFVPIMLFKQVKHHKKYYYIPVGESKTDKEGYYSFEIPRDEQCKYKVVVLDASY